MGTNFFTRYTFANKDFYLNSLEYLVNPTDLLQTRGKEFVLRYLDPQKTEAEKGKWGLINIVLPVSAGYFGGGHLPKNSPPSGRFALISQPF
jgi:hypothetical protein